MTQDEVYTWMATASFLRLESRILKMSEGTKRYSLEWARKYLNEGCDPVRMKWAVAIVGTLAPEELGDEEDDRDILDAEVLE